MRNINGYEAEALTHQYKLGKLKFNQYLVLTLSTLTVKKQRYCVQILYCRNKRHNALYHPECSDTTYSVWHYSPRTLRHGYGQALQ